jgi:cytochrome c551
MNSAAKGFPLFVLFLLFISSSCGTSSSKTSVKFKQYYLKGETLYLQHCSNCHQKDGSGLGQLFPPLSSADYLKNRDAVICLIRYGKSGELFVNGKQFDHKMPANPNLTDIEVAEIATYIYNSWSNSGGLVEVMEVSKTLSGCAESKVP